jgi:hypothetical protein
MPMRSSYALAISLAAAVLFGGASAAVRAQCRLCSTPTTEVQQDGPSGPIALEVQATLDFDRLVLLGSGGGTATLLPNGTRSASGSVATVSASAMVGSVSVHGEPNRNVRVDLPPRIELYSVNGAKIAIDHVETDLPGLARLDSAGNLSFRFGGRLQISGDADGEYRGEIPITVDYL